MAILSDAHKQKVKEIFDAQLKGPVEVLLFQAEAEEQFTAAAREIVSELAALSEGRISLKEMDLAANQEAAVAYHVEQVPALVLLGAEGSDTRARFYGAPVGYEFMALLDDLVDVSAGQTRLSESSRAQIQGIDQEVTIQVFSTPG